MSIARTLYPDVGSCDYQPIIDHFGHVAVQVEEDDYQGDSWVLYHNGNRVGFLTFGWGSCSGCDALQACSNYEELDELIEEMRRGIRWFASVRDCQDFFSKHDWEGDFGWSRGALPKFVERAKRYLRTVSEIERLMNSMD